MRITRYLYTGLVLLAVGCFMVSPLAAQSEELPLGSELPSLDESLQQTDGTSVQLPQLTGSTATVLIFWSNQCPWVRKYESRVAALSERFSGEGVRFVLVNANDPSAFPQESLEASQAWMGDTEYEGTYVHDANGALARVLGASRTPHVFIFDGSQTLVYTGAIDDSPSDPDRAKTAYVEAALAAITTDQELDVSQTKAFGCTIKTQQ